MKQLRALCSALIAALFLLCGLVDGQVPPEYRAELARGDTAFNAHDYKSAIAAWTPVVAKLKTAGKHKLAAEVGINVGLAFYRMNDVKDAELAFGDAEASARHAHDPGILANVLLKVGLIEKTVGNYKAALRNDLQARAIHHTLGDGAAEAQDLVNAGNVQELMTHYDDAMRSFRAALPIARAARSPVREGDAYAGIGGIFDDHGRFNDAMTAYRRAYALHHGVSPTGEAADLGNIGSIAAELGHYDDALRFHRLALAIDRAQHEPGKIAIELYGIGNVEQTVGQYGRAASAYREALASFVAAKNPGGQAAVLSGMGNIAFRTAQYDSALRFYSEALKIEEQIGGEVSPILGNIGDVDFRVGLYEEALTALRKAYARRQKDRDGKGNDLSTIGAVEFERRNYVEALRSLRQALALHRQAGDRQGVGVDLNRIGMAQNALGRHAEALRYFLESYTLLRSIGDRHGQADALTNAARSEARRHKYGMALRHARMAAAFDRQLEDSDALWGALGTVASIEAALGHREDAISAYEQSLTEIDRTRAGLSPDQRPSYLSEKLYAFDEYIVYLERLNRQAPGRGYDRRAFETLERKEARATLDDIARSSAQRYAGLPPALLAADRETRAAVETADQKLASKVDNPPGARANLLALYQAAVARRTSFEERLRRGFSAYYELLHPRPVGADRIQQLLAPDEALLEYDALPSRSLLFVVTRDRLSVFGLPASGALRTSVDRVRAHIDRLLAQRAQTQLERTAAKDLPMLAADSLALYRQIVPRGAAPMLNGKRLIVVPSGPLYEVAIKSLVTQRSGSRVRYLIEDHAVSYTPSASLLDLVRKRQPPSRGRLPLLAFANAKPADVSVGRQRLHLEPLQHAVEEADLVRNVLHAPSESVLEGDDATKARLLSLNASRQLASYRYVLFATHAVLTRGARGSEEPALVLADWERHGLVSVRDVLGLTLDADLVALSACSTGQGAGSPGEGINALTRAFMFAGAPAMLVTLWEVDDQAAPQITPYFFAEMSAGAPPAAALRAAKLNMLHSAYARFRHPYAWGPSVVFGDGDRAT